MEIGGVENETCLFLVGANLSLAPTRARGVAWLTRLPVTQEIAGSNPVGPAKKCKTPLWGVFHFLMSLGLRLEPAKSERERTAGSWSEGSSKKARKHFLARLSGEGGAKRHR